MSFFKFFIFFYVFIIIQSEPSCQEHKNLCNHCNILTNLCVKCEKSEILIPDNNGGCVGAKNCVLGKNYCLECDLEGKLCQNCDENYYPDENGGCTYTEGCEISYMGECLKCNPNFVLIGRENDLKICKSILLTDYKNCKQINYETGFCSECEEGYYLTSGDYKCIMTENCKESIFGNCISCNQGYYFNKKENKCEVKNRNFTYCKQTIDDNNCEICDDDYFLDGNGICTNSQFCLESEYFRCKKCISGYFLSNNNVCTKTDNCYNADKIISMCISCRDDYYLDLKDYQCKSNLENGPYKYCKKVNNDRCVQCKTYYYLGEDAKCSNSLYCTESENGKCISCKEDYHLGLDNICSNVDKCIYSGYDSCIECEDGYYYNKINKTCSEMKDQFLNCKFSCDYEKDKCCECKNNYYLYQNDSLCYDNTKEEEFIKCAYVNNSREKCNRCVEGYYLGTEDSKCCKVEKCKIVENENKCLECDTFYCLDIKKQECIDNDYLDDINDKKYISCKRTNEEGTACEECINGYQLNQEGYCVDIDFCEEKKDGKCLKCKDIISENGYGFCANEIFGCIESAKENCLRCDNLMDLYECTECKEGYQKNFSQCSKIE